MRFATSKVKDFCRQNGLQLREALEQAQVSRTAYYSLARSESVLPRSIHRLANLLGVKASALLSEPEAAAERLKQIVAETAAIVARHPGADPDNVRHTLLLLEEEPVQRLRRGLIRGQRLNFHR